MKLDDSVSAGPSWERQQQKQSVLSPTGNTAATRNHSPAPHNSLPALSPAASPGRCVSGAPCTRARRSLHRPFPGHGTSAWRVLGEGPLTCRGEAAGEEKRFAPLSPAATRCHGAPTPSPSCDGDGQRQRGEGGAAPSAIANPQGRGEAAPSPRGSTQARSPGRASPGDPRRALSLPAGSPTTGRDPSPGPGPPREAGGEV